MSKENTKVNIDSLVNSYKSNMETLAAASRMAGEAFKSISQLQSKYLKESFEEMGNVMKEIFLASGSKDTDTSKVSRSAAQKSWAKAVAHGNSVTQTLSESNTQILNLLKSKKNKEHCETETSCTVDKKTHKS